MLRSTLSGAAVSHNFQGRLAQRRNAVVFVDSPPVVLAAATATANSQSPSPSSSMARLSPNLGFVAAEHHRGRRHSVDSGPNAYVLAMTTQARPRQQQQQQQQQQRLQHRRGISLSISANNDSSSNLAARSPLASPSNNNNQRRMSFSSTTSTGTSNTSGGAANSAFNNSRSITPLSRSPSPAVTSSFSSDQLLFLTSAGRPSLPRQHVFEQVFEGTGPCDVNMTEEDEAASSSSNSSNRNLCSDDDYDDKMPIVGDSHPSLARRNAFSFGSGVPGGNLRDYPETLPWFLVASGRTPNDNNPLMARRNAICLDESESNQLQLYLFSMRLAPSPSL